MSEVPIQRGELQAVPGGEFCQVMIGHLLGSLATHLERWQVVRNSFDGAFAKETLEQGSCLGHGRVDRALIGADAEESQLAERANHKAFARQPCEDLCMAGVINPDCGQQKVYVQQILHGKSFNASARA